MCDLSAEKMPKGAAGLAKKCVQIHLRLRSCLRINLSMQKLPKGVAGLAQKMCVKTPKGAKSSKDEPIHVKVA
jgi:hypothetical protein